MEKLVTKIFFNLSSTKSFRFWYQRQLRNVTFIYVFNFLVWEICLTPLEMIFVPPVGPYHSIKWRNRQDFSNCNQSNCDDRLGRCGCWKYNCSQNKKVNDGHWENPGLRLAWHGVNAQLCLTLCDSMDCSLPGSTDVGCHFLLQGNLPDSGIKLASPESPPVVVLGGCPQPQSRARLSAWSWRQDLPCAMPRPAVRVLGLLVGMV